VGREEKQIKHHFNFVFSAWVIVIILLCFLWRMAGDFTGAELEERLGKIFDFVPYR